MASTGWPFRTKYKCALEIVNLIFLHAINRYLTSELCQNFHWKKCVEIQLIFGLELNQQMGAWSGGRGRINHIPEPEFRIYISMGTQHWKRHVYGCNAYPVHILFKITIENRFFCNLYTVIRDFNTFFFQFQFFSSLIMDLTLTPVLSTVLA